MKKAIMLCVLLSACDYTLPPEPGPDAGTVEDASPDGASLCDATVRTFQCGPDLFHICVPETGCSPRFWCEGHWYWYCAPDGGL